MRIPDGLWIKCDICAQIIYSKDLEKNLKLCPKCGYHFSTSLKEYVGMLFNDNYLIDGSKRDEEMDNFTVHPKFSSVISKDGKINKHRFILAAAYLDCESGFKSFPIELEDKFLNSISASIPERIPLITLHPISPIKTLYPNRKLSRLAVRIIDLMSELSSQNIFHLSILGNFSRSSSIFDLMPLGHVVISEPQAQIDSRTSKAFDPVLVDLSVSRKELKEVLCRLLNFFAD